MRRVEVVVDELILRGVSPAHAHAVASTLEARLAVLAEGGAPVRGRDEAFRRLAPVTAAEKGFGDAVADAVWGAIA